MKEKKPLVPAPLQLAPSRSLRAQALPSTGSKDWAHGASVGTPPLVHHDFGELSIHPTQAPTKTPDPLVTVPDLERRQARRASNDRLAWYLRNRYGLNKERPFREVLENPSNEAQRRFARALPEVTRYLNQLLKENGAPFQVTEAEIAANCLAEGLILKLMDNTTEGISGFDAIGIDTLVSYKVFPQGSDSWDDPSSPEIDLYESRHKKWLPPFLRTKLESGQFFEMKELEKPNKKNPTSVWGKTLMGLTLEEAMYANAGMYVASKSLAVAGLKAHNIDITRAPPEALIFWAFLYFNTGQRGIEYAEKNLRKFGFESYKGRWTGADNYDANKLDGRFNAYVRMWIYEYLNAGEFPLLGPPYKAPGPAQGSLGNSEPTALKFQSRKFLCGQITELTKKLGPSDETVAYLMEFKNLDGYLYETAYPYR